MSLCLIARCYLFQQLWPMAARACTEALHLDLNATSRGANDMEPLPATFAPSVKVDQFSALSMRMLALYEINMLDAGVADYILLHRLSLLTHFTLFNNLTPRAPSRQSDVNISTKATMAGDGFQNSRAVNRRWGRTPLEMKRLADKESKKKQKPIPQIHL
eukprot:GHVS01090474.1.p1 GENE.GHVS01090474.1~~GHVS01090474.1.p1  ORF type:complete len:160 (-),score=10.08 GHVS01090474.1:682-1161(-)